MLNSNSNYKNILINLFFVVVIYFLAVAVGVFIKRHNEFYVPVIFGLMYGNYMAISYFIPFFVRN